MMRVPGSGSVTCRVVGRALPPAPSGFIKREGFWEEGPCTPTRGVS